MGCGSSKGAQGPGTGQSAPEPAATSQVPPEDQAIAQLKVLFDGIDNNSDKTVDGTELADVMKKNEKFGELVKQALPETDTSNVEAVFSMLDTNKDGRVSWEEFLENLKKAATTQVEKTGQVEAAEQTVQEIARSRLQAIFKSIDSNSDDSVSRDELAAKLNSESKDDFIDLLKRAGLETNFSVLDQLDANQDGKVTFDEFMKKLEQAATAEVKETGDVAAAPPPPPDVKIEDQGQKGALCCSGS